MVFFRVSIVSAMLIFLVSCGGQREQVNLGPYAQGGRSSRLLSVSGLKSANPVYAMPRSPGTVSSKLPDLTPPNRLGRQARGALKDPFDSRVVNNSLYLKAKKDWTWSHLQPALAQTPYPVLDKDRLISVYYLLDKVRTNNKVVSSTPIYRLTLSNAADGYIQLALVNQSRQPLNPVVSKRIYEAIIQQLTVEK